MITFTLPAQLRGLAMAQPRAVYAALFDAASQTVKGFGAHPLKAEFGQCAVLHNHNRRLDLHPHVHVVVPVGLPRQWVVDCRNVGCGEPALQYLSRYLYRGVIRERDLVGYDDASGTVTFRHRDAQARKPACRTLPIADFPLALAVACAAHRLSPRARVRLSARQGQATARARADRAARHDPGARTAPRPGVCCPQCHAPMRLVAVRVGRRPDG